MVTHEVFNQSPPFPALNLVAADPGLRTALAAGGADPDAADLLAFGEAWGGPERADLGRLANENPPRLRSHDARGRRADLVDFHPAYHALMAASVADGLAGAVWEGADPAAPRARGHLARAARLYVIAGVEAGHVCPLTMTSASVAALAAAPDLLADILPKVTSRTYDPAFRPMAEKAGVTLGMGMTEKQGGTDVRANTTRAEPLGGGAYAVTGHKWFLSAPMCDAFLVLAQAPGGLTALLLPRHRPDGTANALRLQRLKDKLGNRSNASAEVEFDAAHGVAVGPEGRGVQTIIRMVQPTRIDCAVSSAGLARAAVAEAVHHARHRSVFQRRLADQPAMTAVLADLALEAEAMTALAFALCAALDRGDEARARLVTPAAKFSVCKGAPALIAEAMECLGGNGYVEESRLPRLYREAPVNAIWEGSGNVMALDVLRAAARAPEEAAAVVEDLADEAAGLPGVEAAVGEIGAALDARMPEARARLATERLATLAATAALARSAPPEIAEAYARTRLDRPLRAFGTADLGPLAAVLVARALP